MIDLPVWLDDRLRIYPNAVSREECAAVVAKCGGLNLSAGPLHNNLTGERFHDSNFRMTSVGWYGVRDWVFELVRKYADLANSDWGFELTEADELQYAAYRKNDFFECHKDMLRVRNGAIRKVSVVLQLDPPEAYRGGRLEFLDEDFGSFRPNAFAAQGSVAVFSSLLKHRVTPVKEGERRSLTAWFKGPPFR